MGIQARQPVERPKLRSDSGREVTSASFDRAGCARERAGYLCHTTDVHGASFEHRSCTVDHRRSRLLM